MIDGTVELKWICCDAALQRDTCQTRPAETDTAEAECNDSALHISGCLHEQEDGGAGGDLKLADSVGKACLPASGGTQRERRPAPVCACGGRSQSQTSRWQGWRPWWCREESPEWARPGWRDPCDMKKHISHQIAGFQTDVSHVVGYTDLLRASTVYTAETQSAGAWTSTK